MSGLPTSRAASAQGIGASGAKWPGQGGESDVVHDFTPAHASLQNAQFIRRPLTSNVAGIRTAHTLNALRAGSRCRRPPWIANVKWAFTRHVPSIVGPTLLFLRIGQGPKARADALKWRWLDHAGHGPVGEP